MPMITPRRRFLITAPLALLLPAGLLTYLGLETVRGVDLQYERMALEKVDTIAKSVRDRTIYRIIYTIQHPFYDLFEKEAADQFPGFPLPDGFSFHVGDPIVAAGKIFVYGSDQNIYFFERKEKPPPQTNMENEQSEEESTWIISSATQSVVANRLKSTIEADLISARNTEGQSRSIKKKEFKSLYYPQDELYPYDENRELVFYNIFNETNPPGQIHWIQAIGLMIDFHYVNNVFFDSLLHEMWPELQYPIAIEDDLLQKRVAIVNEPGMGEMRESVKYNPKNVHNEYFPWYRIHFSASIGEDVMQIANNLKIFYYSLIATANLIMIISVIGALRNIAKELALSDLRSNFVARVSHELRTPLGLIRLYSETLELNRAKTEEKRREYLHAITKESERLTHMINNILNFSRIEANSQHYTFTLCSLDPIVIDTVDTMRYHFERHGLEINVSIDDNLPLVRCDADALRQALYNLLNNAMKYSGDGKEIDVRAYSSNGEVIIDVTDRGIGIAPDQHEKIFDEFYRVDDPRVRETGGSGLGLAVVKHIVTAHKGKLSVKSKLQQGSTFSIHIPIFKENHEHVVI